MANADLKTLVSEQLRKWQELSRFINDPETAPIIEQLVAAQNGHTKNPITALPPRSLNPKKRKKGAFIKRIEEVCQTFCNPGEEFTVRNVIVQYEQRGYVFGASDKLVATNSALKRLVKRGVIEVSEKGSGHTPSTYKLIQRFPRLIGGEKAG